MLVKRHIRDEGSPLHRGQHAFQAGCSVDTALHNAVVTHIERQFEQGSYDVMGTFLDIEGAFTNTPSVVIIIFNAPNYNFT